MRAIAHDLFETDDSMRELDYNDIMSQKSSSDNMEDDSSPNQSQATKLTKYKKGVAQSKGKSLS